MRRVQACVGQKLAISAHRMEKDCSLSWKPTFVDLENMLSIYILFNLTTIIRGKCHDPHFLGDKSG